MVQKKTKCDGGEDGPAHTDGSTRITLLMYKGNIFHRAEALLYTACVRSMTRRFCITTADHCVPRSQNCRNPNKNHTEACRQKCHGCQAAKSPLMVGGGWWVPGRADWSVAHFGNSEARAHNAGLTATSCHVRHITTQSKWLPSVQSQPFQNNNGRRLMDHLWCP